MSKKNKKRHNKKKQHHSQPTEVKQSAFSNKDSKNSLVLSVLYAIIIIGLCVIAALLCIHFINNSDTKAPAKDTPVFRPVTEQKETITPETFVTSPETVEAAPPPQTADETAEMAPPKENNQVLLTNVKNILQLPGLPNGCEVTSLAIALNYYGYDIDPITLYYDFMPTSEYQNGDPWTTYVGDATGWGLGCYAPCVVKTGNDYINSVLGEHIVRDVSYKKLSDYEKFIDEGTPVILWGMLDMEWNPDLAWAGYLDGKNVTWYSHSHCMVLIGYTDDDYIFCDPLQGIMRYNKYKVLDCFTALFKQACVIEKYDPAFDESYTEKVFDETCEESPEDML